MGFSLTRDEVRSIVKETANLSKDLKEMSDKLDSESAAYAATRQAATATAALGTTAMTFGLLLAPFTGGASLGIAAYGATAAGVGTAVATAANYIEKSISKDFLDAAERKYAKMRQGKAVDVFVGHGIKLLECELVGEKGDATTSLDTEFSNYTSFRQIERKETVYRLEIHFLALLLPPSIYELLMNSLKLFLGKCETVAGSKVREFAIDLKAVGERIDKMEDELRQCAMKTYPMLKNIHWNVHFEEYIRTEGKEYEKGLILLSVET